MAKTLLKAMRKHRRVILIIAILAFILLVILGFAMGPDKTWRPSGTDGQTQDR